MVLEKSHRKPVLVHHPRLWLSRLKRSWPFLVWVVAIMICLYFYNTHSRFWGITGVVQSKVEMVAPLETARLQSIVVVPGDRVTNGQVLAYMDTTLLDAEIAVDEAMLMEAEGNIAGFQQNMLQIVRQFEEAISGAQMDLEQVRSERKQTVDRLAEVNREMKNREELFAKQLIPSSELYPLRAEAATLTAALDGFDVMEKVHLESLQRAEHDRAELQRALQVEKGESVAVAIARKMDSRRHILETTRKQRLYRRDRYVLKASHEGVVSRIYAEEGDVINAGEDVMRLVAETSGIVEGFLPETYVSEVAAGQVMRILARNGRVEMEARVESISPEILALPGRVSPIMNQRSRGRRILLNMLDENHPLLPGETVKIRPAKTRLFGNNGEAENPS